MGANKIEAFDVEVIQRDRIMAADYNPRRITPEAKKKLTRFLKQKGLWSPLIWNRRTGNLVSGHQRLSIMDTLIKDPNYELTVSIVDVDEETEVSGNVFMNNTSAMGEWDFDVLESLAEMFPEMDYEKDFGFDAADIDLFLPTPAEQKRIEKEFDTPPKKELTPEEIAEIKEIKKASREDFKAHNLDGKGASFVDSDFTVTVVFNSASAKREFVAAVGEKETQKRITQQQLYDFISEALDGQS